MSDPELTTSHDVPHVRTCTIDEARDVPGLSGLPASPAAGTQVLLLEAGGSVRGAAIIDPHGGPTEPEAPLLLVSACGPAEGGGSPPALHPEDEVRPLVRAALAAAAAEGIERLVTGCDPMDLARVKAFEAEGFAPTGRQPYFVLGGGHVEYVMGYADASGATMDLEARPGG